MSAARTELQERIARLDQDRRERLLATLRADRPAAPRTGSWFLRPQPAADPGLRLFCFPYAGSGASVFRGWAGLLPDGVEVCAVQLPGREWRVDEPAYRRLDDLLPDLASAIDPLTDVPFAFFGHSMGALVAYELTRLLRRTGRPQPAQLLVSAFRAPHLPNPNIRIHHLPDEVLKTVLRKDGTPEEVLGDDELMRALLPTLRADLELCDTYRFRPEAPLAVPIRVFGGLSDVRVGRGDLEQWADLGSDDVPLTLLPGSHFFLHASQDLLLEALTAHLRPHHPSQGVVA